MSDFSYRIRTEASSNKDMVINIPIHGTFDMFEILSLELSQKNLYKVPQAGYGVLIGRVLANGGFGIPNAKISIFIPYSGNGTEDEYDIYHYSSVTGVNHESVRYNILSSDVDDVCHQDVGTFPTKRYMLDNGAIIDVFDKYYKYTTSTNKAGDYMIYGVPVGVNELHVDIDLSDIGMLSQTPRDMIYKGYNINQFESPTMFKKSENLASLPQIYTQNKSVYIYPFWGDTTDSNTDASVTRCDVKIDYKFEPTCVFIGSVITDSGSNGISKRCIPSANAGKMSELRAGEGMMEMIRKTPTGKVEYYSVQGNMLIDGDGVWCYQIPMNLDYVKTDEFGNMVPSDDPENGIPTRARVRFRASLTEMGDDGTGFKRGRFLIPNNPELSDSYTDDDIDYEFGSLTKEDSFRDLLWNHVYTVKSYIPRLQKDISPLTKHFTGIKAVNHGGDNNPVPYNNINIRLTFTYRVTCMVAFVIISIVTMLNIALTGLAKMFWVLGGAAFDAFGNNWIVKLFSGLLKALFGWWCNPIWKAIGCGIELKGWCADDEQHFFPGCGRSIPEGMYNNTSETTQSINQSFNHEDSSDEEQSGGINFVANVISGTAYAHSVEDYLGITINNSSNDLMECVQADLAESNEVVSLNFQNDWLNGSLYMPLWGRKIRRHKYSIFGLKLIRNKDIFCNSLSDSYVKVKFDKRYTVFDRKYAPKSLRLYHTCSQQRTIASNGELEPLDDYGNIIMFPDPLTGIETGLKASSISPKTCYGLNCDKVFDYTNVNGGVITEKSTMRDEYVYYYKPASSKNGKAVHLFSTDIVLLGSLNSCTTNGTPQFFRRLQSTTYKLPPNLIMNDIEGDSVTESESENSYNPLTQHKNEQADVSGSDWGNTGVGQQNEITIFGIRQKSFVGGLFYGLTCNFTSVSPKSCVNLSRVCEYGVNLDESKMVYNGSTEQYEFLAPDGYISTDEVDDPDGRSMFATLNGNGLKTKPNPITGYPEYDFEYSYQQWFDKSSYKMMEQDLSNVAPEYKYKNNYKLEDYSNDYVRFRYGNNSPKFYKTSVKLSSFGNKIPDYNNSFYFYFGLKEGKTAIDKFRKLYYSECVEDKEENTVDIQFEANSWCSEATENGNGYIALDMQYVDAPYTVAIDSRADNNYDHIGDIPSVSYPRIYIGTSAPSSIINRYEQLKYYDETDDEYHPIPLVNGPYVITITDANNETTSFTVNFTEDVLSFDATKEDFLVAEEILYDNNGPYATCPSNPYYCVAQYNDNGERAIGGYISINNISEAGDDYVIEITPAPGYSFNDFEDSYTGDTITVSGGHATSEHGTLITTEQPYIIGVPKGDVAYNIRITQTCGERMSRNTGSTSLFVRRYSLPALYINGIDSRLISRFGTGWNVVNNTGVESDQYTLDTARMWVEGLDNIGGPDVKVINIPETGSPAWISDGVKVLYDAISPETEYQGCYYSWTSDYVATEEKTSEFIHIPSVNRELTILNSDGEVLFETEDLTLLSDGMLSNIPWEYVFGPYANGGWPTYFMVLREDGFSYKYFKILYNSDSATYITKPVQSVSIAEFYNAITTSDDERNAFVGYLNTVVEKREALPLDMKKAFWVSGAQKHLTIELDSERLPLKYLTFGPLINNLDLDNITHTFGMLDDNMEESDFICDIPQITYKNEELSLSTDNGEDDGRWIEPYYCSAKDDSDIVVPNILTPTQFMSNANLNGMAPVMFFKRPLKADILTWSYISYPNHIREGYTEKMGVLIANIKNGITTSHHPKGNETFFEEQTFNGENVRIVTTDIISADGDIPDEYAYPTKRKLFTTIPMGVENMYTYGFFRVSVYEDGGISLENYGYHPLSEIKSNLIVNDGTYTVSEIAYGNFNLVVDYAYETTWDIPLMEHDLVSGDCFVRFQPNQTIENMYENSCFCVVNHVDSNYPLDDSYSGELFSAYTIETLYERCENDEYLIQYGDVDNIIHYDNPSALHPIGIRSFSDEMQGDGDIALNISTTESFYCFAIAATNDHNFACVYSPLYQMTSVMDMHFNEQEMPGYQVYDGWIYIKIPLTGSYLRTHNSSIEITDTGSGNVLFTKNDVTPEEYAMTNPNQPTWKKFKAGNVIPSTTTHVKISVTDVTGLTHSRTLTISGFLG